MKVTLGLVFGLLVLLAGASIILDALFDVHVPLFRSGLALVLIFIGARILIGAWSSPRTDPATNGALVMEDRVYAPGPGSPERMKYDVVFGRGVIDLTALPADRDRTVEVNTVFGAAEIRVSPTIPYEVDATSAFGEARTPDRVATGFGSVHYQPPGILPRRLHLRVNSVFGSSRVVEVTPPVPPPAEAMPLPAS
jgi:hypothetical protein